MALALRSAHQLVDELLDLGLPSVASYLEQMIHHKIMITDGEGLIHYPNPAHEGVYFDFVSSCNSSHNYHYDSTRKYLFYRVDYSRDTAWVIVPEIKQKSVLRTLSILGEARLAIKCYFANLTSFIADQTFLRNKLISYLFSDNDEGMEDIAKLLDSNWNINSTCYVAVFKADENEKDVQWDEVYSFSLSYFRQLRFEAIPMVGPNCFIVLWPDRFIYEVNDCMDLPQLHLYHEAIKSRLPFKYSVGIGGTYPTLQLRRSFQEARIAVTVPALRGQREYIQHFQALGFLTQMFSNDTDVLRAYCSQTLGKIIEHDNSNHGELVYTLRQLLNTGFNCRATADKLFIHINTLYYRMNKIEELLGSDLSQMSTRVNLYAAIQVWDTLNSIT
ncbi:MAG: helix-turn-helix domain-containing protein [Syntrophomonadaceae bacterium]